MCNKDANLYLTFCLLGVFKLFVIYLAVLSNWFPTGFHRVSYWDDYICRQMSNQHLTIATDAPYFRWSRPTVAPGEGAHGIFCGGFLCSRSRKKTRVPGISKCPFVSLFGGHVTSTTPKRSQRIARYPRFCLTWNPWIGDSDFGSHHFWVPCKTWGAQQASLFFRQYSESTVALRCIKHRNSIHKKVVH